MSSPSSEQAQIDAKTRQQVPNFLGARVQERSGTYVDWPFVSVTELHHPGCSHCNRLEKRERLPSRRLSDHQVGLQRAPCWLMSCLTPGKRTTLWRCSNRFWTKRPEGN